MVTNCNCLLFFYGRISQGLGMHPPTLLLEILAKLPM